MRLDFSTLAFGYKIKAGGGTPNWATSLGQGKDYKIIENAGIDELLRGMVYTAVPLSKVTVRIGKGGKVVSANEDNSPIIVASLFRKVYVNDTLIIGGNFVILITRDTSKSHKGRLRFKYGPSNSFNDNDTYYSNEGFWKKVKNQLSLNDDSCFFVYDISVKNQEELILSTIVVDENGRREYLDSKDQHTIWNELINNHEKSRRELSNTSVTDKVEDTIITMIDPLWFHEKALLFPGLDFETEKIFEKFKTNFGPDKLRVLSGSELLYTIFFNDKNSTNLCYILESDTSRCKIFCAIRSKTLYKYDLHYSVKKKSWVTGTENSPEILTEEDAINLGTRIRDNLIFGANLIDDFGELKTLQDYQRLYDDLNDITNGFINHEWFLKYYSLIFPKLFPPICAGDVQNIILNKIGIVPGDNLVYRSGQIKQYVDKCNISNVVFSKIFWTYCMNSMEEIIELKNCLEIPRNPRTNKVHPLNSIVYGAPGTGKTYSMVEYALSIIEGIEYENFKKNNTDRKKNIEKYKALVKQGQIVFTTFHQNYGYEEFIQGLRPDTDSGTLAFKTVDGVFKVIADNALNDTEGNNYVIIIDEINRANISKVFGELITLIEEDKRWGELNETSVTLQSGDVFAVPNNLYIVGTMNSADKSISLIDAALRRRFDFIEQRPNLELIENGTLKSVLEKINNCLINDLGNTDLLIGHSYFMKKNKNDLVNIFNNNIIPLLYEYYYDDRRKVKNLLDGVIKDTGISVEIIDEKFGRLRVKDVQ